MRMHASKNKKKNIFPPQTQKFFFPHPSTQLFIKKSFSFFLFIFMIFLAMSYNVITLCTLTINKKKGEEKGFALQFWCMGHESFKMCGFNVSFGNCMCVCVSPRSVTIKILLPESVVSSRLLLFPVMPSYTHRHAGRQAHKCLWCAHNNRSSSNKKKETKMFFTRMLRR